MKSLIAILALGVAAALTPAIAAEAVADMKPPAKWAPTKKTMEKNGRFHYLHVKKEKMDCADCHTDASKDRLFLRNTEAPPATLTAHVNRSECTECHQGDKKLKWYGAKPR
jgi:hypothetical protein